MSIPFNYGYPVLRPGVVIDASFQGSDANLVLQLNYINEFGNQQLFNLRASSVAQGPGLICLPSGATILDVNRDALVASIRMATLISRMIPGSNEWMDAMTTGQSTMDFQTALGNVKIKEIRIISDTLVQLDMVKKGTSSPIQTIQTDYNELGTYTFAPDTQLHCVAGAIEKQYPSYVHNPATSQYLSASQKDDIVTYVKSLAIWV